MTQDTQQFIEEQKKRLREEVFGERPEHDGCDHYNGFCAIDTIERILEESLTAMAERCEQEIEAAEKRVREITFNSTDTMIAMKTKEFDEMCEKVRLDTIRKIWDEIDEYLDENGFAYGEAGIDDILSLPSLQLPDDEK